MVGYLIKNKISCICYRSCNTVANDTYFDTEQANRIALSLFRNNTNRKMLKKDQYHTNDLAQESSGNYTI